MFIFYRHAKSSRKIWIFAALIIGFSLSHFYDLYFLEQTPFNELLITHKLLRKCKSGTRELNFLKLGGEYFADYDNPRTLNDKVGYIFHNYYCKSPITEYLNNKYTLKKIIANLVGKEYVVKLLGVWNKASDIEWNKLPNCFVLKTVRGCHGKQVIVVKDKSKIDITETINKLENFCKTVRSMKNIKENRIIAEEYLENFDQSNVIDYKFFCSFGKVLFAYCLSTEKENNNSHNVNADNKTLSFYSLPEWNVLPFTTDGRKNNDLPKPKHLEKMIMLAEKISKHFPLIRVDLYECGDRVLVGELTDDPSGAKSIFKPVIWDFKLGEMIDTPTLDQINAIIEDDKNNYVNAITK